MRNIKNQFTIKLLITGIAINLLLVGITAFNSANLQFLKPQVVSAAALVYTTTANLNIRVGPSTKYSILGTVKKGSKLNVTGKAQNGWYKVIYKGKTGYTSGLYVKTVNSPTYVSYQYITTANLNVRNGSSVTYRVLGVLKEGSTLSVQKKLSNGWYQINYNRKIGFVNGQYVMVINTATTFMMNVPIVLQMPQLPNGCEVTSLTMALKYKGIKIDKITAAKQMPYTHTLDANKGFIGSPFNSTGNTINPVSLQKLAKTYRPRSADITDAGIATIEKEVRAGNPVLVWYTIGYIEPKNHYLYQNGHRYWFPEPLHCIVVTGASSHYFYINDPLNGNKNHPIEKSRFNLIYTEMGKRALVVR
jgi:uncharacterized protein YvpB